MKKSIILTFGFLLFIGLHIDAQVIEQVQTNATSTTTYEHQVDRKGDHKKKRRIAKQNRKAAKQQMKSMRKVAAADGVITKEEKAVMKREKRKMKQKAKHRRHNLKSSKVRTDQMDNR